MIFFCIPADTPAGRSACWICARDGAVNPAECRSLTSPAMAPLSMRPFLPREMTAYRGGGLATRCDMTFALKPCENCWPSSGGWTGPWSAFVAAFACLLLSAIFAVAVTAAA